MNNPFPNLSGAISANLAKIAEVDNQLAEAAHLRNNPVIEICQAIQKYIEAFENELDNEHEIGIRLASFGGVVIFHAEQIGFSKPNVITFYGITDEGEKVQLIQHVSQLSFLLKAVKKREDKPYRIGFVWPDS